MSDKTKNTVRVFVAVELDDGVKRHITAAIDALRQERINGLRLVRPEGVHLTLKFLGDINAARVPQVEDAMASAASRHAPFDLTLGAPGVFPNARRARVLWLGVEGDMQPLRRLQEDVDRALAAVGFPAENRPFNPHLTIGRMRPRASDSDRRRAVDALSALPLPQDRAIAVNAVSLMKSDLLPGGAVYARLSHSCLAPLRADAHA